jgi:hypothetical protein
MQIACIRDCLKDIEVLFGLVQQAVLSITAIARLPVC